MATIVYSCSEYAEHEATVAVETRLDQWPAYYGCSACWVTLADDSAREYEIAYSVDYGGTPQWSVRRRKPETSESA